MPRPGSRIRDLHNTLLNNFDQDGRALTTYDFDEFRQAMTDPAYRNRVFNLVSGNIEGFDIKLYTKSWEDFNNYFTLDQDRESHKLNIQSLTYEDFLQSNMGKEYQDPDAISWQNIQEEGAYLATEVKNYLESSGVPWQAAMWLQMNGMSVTSKNYEWFKKLKPSEIRDIEGRNAFKNYQESVGKDVSEISQLGVDDRSTLELYIQNKLNSGAYTGNNKEIAEKIAKEGGLSEELKNTELYSNFLETEKEEYEDFKSLIIQKNDMLGIQDYFNIHVSEFNSSFLDRMKQGKTTESDKAIIEKDVGLQKLEEEIASINTETTLKFKARNDVAAIKLAINNLQEEIQKAEGGEKIKLELSLDVQQKALKEYFTRFPEEFDGDLNSYGVPTIQQEISNIIKRDNISSIRPGKGELFLNRSWASTYYSDQEINNYLSNSWRGSQRAISDSQLDDIYKDLLSKRTYGDLGPDFVPSDILGVQDRQELYDWIKTNSEAQGKIDMFDTKYEWDADKHQWTRSARDEERGLLKLDATSTREVTLELKQDIKIQIINDFLEHKFEKLEKDNLIYQNNQIPTLIQDVGSYYDNLAILSDKFNKNDAILKEFEKAFEDGKIDRGELPKGYKLEDFEKLIEETNIIANQFNNIQSKIKAIMTPYNQELIRGYTEFSDEFSRFEDMMGRVYLQDGWGKRKEELERKQRAADLWFEQNDPTGILGGGAAIWNGFVEGVPGGIVHLINAGSDWVGAQDSNSRMLTAMELENAMGNMTFSLSSKPVFGENGEFNWGAILPNLSRTMTDMYIMIRGGRLVYSGIAKVGRGTKLLSKANIPINKYGKLYKRGGSAVGTVAGSLPIVYRQHLIEAFNNISEDFTVEEALEYAATSALIEGLIETMNPDFKMLKASNRFKRGKGKFKSKTGDAERVVNKLKKEKSRAFMQSLRMVPKEIAEEFMQTFVNGLRSHFYNNTYGTDFHVPDAREYKETAFLTSLSVLGMRAGSGKMFQADNTSLYRFLSENVSPEDLDIELEKQIKDFEETGGGKGISELDADAIRDKYRKYVFMSNQVSEWFQDEDGETYITPIQFDGLVDLLIRQSNLQNEIKQGKDTKRLKELLKEVDAEIDSYKNDVKQNSKYRENEKNKDEITKLENKLNRTGKDKLGDKARKETKKELDNLKRKKEKLESELGDYYIDGKVYRDKKSFLDKIRQHRDDGRFKQGVGLTIDSKHDFEALKEAYAIMGVYAPKSAKEQVVMTQSQVNRIQNIIGQRTEEQIREELKEAEAKNDKKKIHQLKEAVKYFELKNANYEVGTKGFLVTKPRDVSRWQRLRLDRNIKFLENYGERIGGNTEVIGTQEAFNERMMELSWKHAKLARAAAERGDEISKNLRGPVDIKAWREAKAEMRKHQQLARDYMTARSSDGFFDSGAKTFYINQALAIKNGAITVGSHELLHAILFKSLRDTDPNSDTYGELTDEGLKFIEEFLNIVGKTNRSWLDKKLKPYVSIIENRPIKDKNGKSPGHPEYIPTYAKEVMYDKDGEMKDEYKKEYYEEYLTKFHDGIKKNKIQYEEGIWNRIREAIRSFLGRQANVDTDFKNGRDVYNFLKAYTEDVQSGTLRGKFIELGQQSLESIKTDVASRIQMSLSRDPEEFTTQNKDDLFSITNEELSISLEGYGFDEPFDRENPRHVKMWNDIPRQDKMFIGYAIGQHWRKFAGSKFDASTHSNKFNYDRFRDQLIDVLATGIETGQNGLPFLVANWKPSERKLTSHIFGELPKRIHHITTLPQFAELGRVQEDEDTDDASKPDDTTKQYKLYTRLNDLAVKHNENIKKLASKMTDQEVEGHDYKSLPDLDVKTTAELFGIDVGKLDPSSPQYDANLRIDSKEGTNELLAAQMVINNNAQDFKNSLPKHHTTKRVKTNKKDKKGNYIYEERPHKATGIKKVILEEFYIKGERGSGNLTPWTLNENITLEQFRNVFGIINRKSFRGDRNISARVLKLAMMTGKLMTNQAVREQLIERGYIGPALATISDGKGALMFHLSADMKKFQFNIGKIDSSLTVPDDQEETQLRKAMFWHRFKSISDVSFLETDEESINLAMRENFKNYDFIIENIDTLSKALFSTVKLVAPKVKTKGIKRGANILQKIYEKNQDALKNIQNFTNSSVPMLGPNGAFKNKDSKRRKRQIRGVDKMYVSEIYEKFIELTDEKGVKRNSIVEFVRYIEQMKGHSTGSPTRAAAYADFKDGKPRHVAYFTEELLGAVQAKYGKMVDGKWIPDLTYDTDANGAITKVYHVSQISKDNPNGKVLAKDKNGVMPGKDGYIETNIDLSFAANTTKAIKNDYAKNKDGSYKFPEKIEKREQDEKETQEFLNSYVEFWSNKFNEGKITEVHLAMIQASLLSNMKTALARAATMKYVSDNYESLRADELRYEHMQPRVGIIISMFDAHINGKGIKNISKFLENYNIAVIPTTMDDVLDDVGLKSSLYKGQTLDMPAWVRYFNDLTIGDSRLRALVNVKTGKKLTVSELYAKSKDILAQSAIEIKKDQILSAATSRSRTVNPKKGISIWDFDDTLARSKSNVLFTAPDGTKGKLTAEEFANKGADLLDQGYKFDFSEFSKVVKGEKGPFFQKFVDRINKFGIKDNFILTARPIDSNIAIQEFLKSQGLDIPLENITGLANSTSEAKALWIAEKVADGYNDIYFADDALQNVQAVKNILDQFDVKSDVQQAKLSFHLSLDDKFNQMLEQNAGVDAKVRYDDNEARLRGRGKGRFKSIMLPSVQDFEGLIYSFLGKGKKGEQDYEFFKKSLIDPFARGYNELNTAKQRTAEDYKALLKELPDIKKRLNKKIDDTGFTYDQAVRVYLWNKAGYKIPGLSKENVERLSKIIEEDASFRVFADSLSIISKNKDGFPEPGEHWLIENISSDLFSDGAVGNARKEYLAEWIQNKDIIFSKENLNKIEAIYGPRFREALEDSLHAMETGRSRPVGGGRLMNMYMNWMNNSVGAIMFFNIRSAVLQTISATNYINWTDNNPLKAAAAFANQKQFWSDFSMIFNSDMLKQRRLGLKYNINEAELAAAVAASDNKAKAAIAWLLKKGFTPTQIADSFAISAGGASFYRNRVKSLMKQNPDMTLKQAEDQAWLDFQEVTEKAQQSSRPDLISQQQRNPLGRLILAFANTPLQYMRIMNKAARDLAAGRGDAKTHISKITYYGVIQSFIFNALQKALFAVIGSGDEEELDDKYGDILNGMLDSWLIGFGYGGRATSTVMGTVKEYLEQRAKDVDDDFMTRSDHTYTILSLLNFSPPLGSKFRKIYSAIQTEKFNRDIMLERGFTLDNPIWSVVGNVVEATTNIPLGRLSNKMSNLDNAMDSTHEWWQRAALVLGWNKWDLGIRDPDIEELGITIKERKKEDKKKISDEKKIIEKRDKIREENPDKSEKEIDIILKSDELTDLNKQQQVDLLKKLGLSDEEIKDLKKEKDRTDKIAELYKDNDKLIDNALKNKDKDKEKTIDKKEEKEIKVISTEEKYEKEQKEEVKNNRSGKKMRCSGVKSNGERCTIKVGRKGGKCTIHQKVEQRTDGKKVQCKKIKSDKKRCGMQTSNKSGYCYYHD